MQSNLDDLKLQLLLGLPAKTIEFGDIYSPKLQEMIQTGYSEYSEMIFTMLINRGFFKGLPDNIEDYDLFSHFLVEDLNHRKKFETACKLLFKSEISYKVDEELGSIIVIGELEDQKFIHQANFLSLQKYIQIIVQNKMEKSEDDEYNPANDAAQQAIDEMLKRRKKNKKPQPKKDSDLHSILSTVISVGNISTEEINNMTIYQFMDRFKRIEMVEHYRNVNVGVYTGNIDTKKFNLKQINWLKIIE